MVCHEIMKKKIRIDSKIYPKGVRFILKGGEANITENMLLLELNPQDEIVELEIIPNE
jgi:hypothetical protein